MHDGLSKLDYQELAQQRLDEMAELRMYILANYGGNSNDNLHEAVKDLCIAVKNAHVGTDSALSQCKKLQEFVDYALENDYELLDKAIELDLVELRPRQKYPETHPDFDSDEADELYYTKWTQRGLNEKR